MICRFRPGVRLPASYPFSPPEAVRTVWESTTAAEGLLVAAVNVPQSSPQHLQDLLPGAVESPAPVVEMDRAPGGQVMWQHPPGNAAADNIEDPVEDLAKVNAPGPPTGLCLGQQRSNDLPLFISHVGRVMLAPHDWLRCTNQAEKSASHTDSQRINQRGDSRDRVGTSSAQKRRGDSTDLAARTAECLGQHRHGCRRRSDA